VRTLNEHSRLTEAAVRISHYLRAEHRVNKMAGPGSGARLLRERLESDGLEIDGMLLTLREGSLFVWAGNEADPLHERVVEFTVDNEGQ
jgi:hypothetical protein